MKKKWICLILISLFFFFPSRVKAKSLKEIKEEIEKVTQLLQEEKSFHQKEKLQADMARKSLEDRVNVLKEKIAEIKKENGKLRKEIRKVESAQENLVEKKKEEKIAFLTSDVKNILFVQAEKLQEKIENGFPYILEERRDKIDSFKGKVKKTEDLLDASRELWSYYLKEIDLGDSSEIYSEEVETGKKEIKKAKFLRVGKFILAYRTNDGKETARACETKDGYKWNKGICSSCKKGIKKAIEIMEGRRVPVLLEFCLPLSQVELKKGDSQ